MRNFQAFQAVRGVDEYGKAGKSAHRKSTPNAHLDRGEFELARYGAAVLRDAQFDGVHGEAALGQDVAVDQDTEEVAVRQIADDL
ncbi:hypothetical protein [Streptomyces sp. NPDC057238]|uniref:hypothetical protein n=1 Tax=Streptomyces sp. NPDC057238 TaxID=3346060 RepID=UPI003632D328